NLHFHVVGSAARGHEGRVAKGTRELRVRQVRARLFAHRDVLVVRVEDGLGALATGEASAPSAGRVARSAARLLLSLDVAVHDHGAAAVVRDLHVFIPRSAAGEEPDGRHAHEGDDDAHGHDRLRDAALLVRVGRPQNGPWSILSLLTTYRGLGSLSRRALSKDSFAVGSSGAFRPPRCEAGAVRPMTGAPNGSPRLTPPCSSWTWLAFALPRPRGRL